MNCTFTLCMKITQLFILSKLDSNVNTEITTGTTGKASKSRSLYWSLLQQHVSHTVTQHFPCGPLTHPKSYLSVSFRRWTLSTLCAGSHKEDVWSWSIGSGCSRAEESKSRTGVTVAGYCSLQGGKPHLPGPWPGKAATAIFEKMLWSWSRKTSVYSRIWASSELRAS